MTLLSSDNEEALRLLFPSPPCNPISRVLEPFSTSAGDQSEDRPEANDIATSAYIALTADVSGSHASTVKVLHDGQKSCADGLST
jgi:hypothetical protein